MSATRRIVRTSVPGSTVLIWNLIEEIYGEQNQRSYSVGVIFRGSRSEKRIRRFRERADKKLPELTRMTGKNLCE